MSRPYCPNCDNDERFHHEIRATETRVYGGDDEIRINTETEETLDVTCAECGSPALLTEGNDA